MRYLALSFVLALAACGSSTPAPACSAENGTCTFNSDCCTGLFCLGGLCHSPSGGNGGGGNGGGTTGSSTTTGTSGTGTSTTSGSSGTTGATCGQLGGACCANDTCSGGLTCNGGICAQQSGGSGQPCSRNSDCPTGICLDVGGGKSVCTTTCQSGTDCVPGWSCGPIAGQSSNICQCTATSETCDGRDNDCNGLVDDQPQVDQLCTAQDGAGAVCSGGACACGGGAQLCSGACTDTNNDRYNCGSCGHACSAPSHGTATCSGGSCGFTCSGAYTSCGGGCVDLSGDPSNCGTCGHVCPAGTNGLASCDQGQCGTQCSTGYVDTDGGCVADPCVGQPDATPCNQIFFPNGTCVSQKCTNPKATCQYETYGTNWQPGTPDVRWGWTVDNSGTDCSCSGSTLTDGNQTASCSQCEYVGQYLYSGGASNPDGITDDIWACY